MKAVILKSGATGHQRRLRTDFKNFGTFESYCEVYNLHKRLGYKSPESAWKANPLIESGTNPSDYRKVTKTVIKQREKNEKTKKRK